MDYSNEMIKFVIDATAPRVAKVRITRPYGWTPQGDLRLLEGAFEWKEIPFLDPWQCEHLDTMCTGCWDSWACDHEVAVDADIELPGELSPGDDDPRPTIADLILETERQHHDLDQPGEAAIYIKSEEPETTEDQ